MARFGSSDVSRLGKLYAPWTRQVFEFVLLHRKHFSFSPLEHVVNKSYFKLKLFRSIVLFVENLKESWPDANSKVFV